MAKARYGVVLIHGQGDQRPMRMGAEFAEHVLQADFAAKGAGGPDVKWRPEEATRLEDIRRIEVRQRGPDPDLDLFEFYWAPRMAGNQLVHFQTWFFNLLRRPAREIPKRVRTAIPLVRAGVWAALFVLLAYLWLTMGALFPVQIVQVYDHGLSDLFAFRLDLRLAVFAIALVLALSAVVAIARRRYGWCLSFCLSAALFCAVAPSITSAEDQISEDVARLETTIGLNVWGARITKPEETDDDDLETIRDKTKVDPGFVLNAIADLSNALCGTDGSKEEHGPASRSDRVVVKSKQELEWTDLKNTGGAELNDLCSAPMVFVSPVVLARAGDSGHMLATILLTFFGAIVWTLWRIYIRPFLVEVMGDSARYLNDRPDNILARHEIRQAGVELLKALHQTGRYDKIIVVAHSLGTVVAYDILRQYWGLTCGKLTLPQTARDNLFSAATAQPFSRALWRSTQAAAFTQWAPKTETQMALKPEPPQWRISDFVTLGSPLAHARLLLEGSPESPHSASRFLAQRDITYAAPACPPVDLDKRTDLDPADLFLTTRWTNLYFSDDLVGGPVVADADGPLFGEGVQDEGFDPLKLTAKGISHNSYWLSRLPPAQSTNVPWLKSLRDILV